jgi:hypothetical protein
MKLITEISIRRASAQWCLLRKKTYDPDTVYSCSFDTVLKVGSVWQNNFDWKNRVESGSYDEVISSLKENGWDASQPVLIGIGSNGFVSLLDGNHRMSILYFSEMYKEIKLLSARFRYFDIGDVINPYAPGIKWDGTNLNFICFPRNTCGKCAICTMSII